MILGAMAGRRYAADMSNSFSSRGERLFPPGLVARWLRRETPHPDSFDCGVRVVRGAVPGLGSRWQYRRSAADPLILDGVVTLNHGAGRGLHLRMEDGWAPHQDRSGSRVGCVLLRAVEVSSGASVEIAVSRDEVERFGISGA